MRFGIENTLKVDLEVDFWTFWDLRIYENIFFVKHYSLYIPNCSKIILQTVFGDIFYTKPHQQIMPDSLVTSELPEKLKIGPKSTRKFSEKP